MTRAYFSVRSRALAALGALATAASCGGNSPGISNPGTDSGTVLPDGRVIPPPPPPPGDGGTTTVTGRWMAVPTGTNADLYGVYGTSATELLAVGAFVTRRYNGSAWSEGPSPSAGETRVTLRAIHGADGTAVAVGNTEPTAGSAKTGVPVFLRAMGMGLSPVMHNAAGVQLHGIYFRSAMEGWAVGENGAFQWNGMRWTSTAMMGLRGSSPTPDLYAVWASGPNDVRAVGNSVYRWDGTTWTAEPQPGSDFYFGIWGSGPSDVWIVGSGVARRWNGTEWRDVRTGAQGRLLAIWGAAANDVWAVGEMGTIVHFDGARWTAIPSGTTQNLRALWGRSASDIWAVGEMGACVRYTR
ncbi:MAG: hypothetical protein HY909_13395 [Deltaproteobacteria bacterium]|nr:hypothetical protein [Deltaproteobacteria bacterium]